MEKKYVLRMNIGGLRQGYLRVVVKYAFDFMPLNFLSTQFDHC